MKSRRMGVATRTASAFLLAVLGASALALSVGTPAATASPFSPVGANWVRAGYNDGNSNFNPQTQINQYNVANLVQRWSLALPTNPFTGTSYGTLTGSASTPLVINGTVYFGTHYGTVVAVNAATGKELWAFQSPLVTQGTNPGGNCSGSTCGVADEMIAISSYGGIVYMQGSSDCTVYGLDAKTGAVVVTIPDPCGGVPGQSPTGKSYEYSGRQAPAVYEKGGVALVGEAGETTGRGFVAGYSVATGKLLWRWFVVPPQGGDPNWDSEDIVQIGSVPCNGPPYTGPSCVNYGPPKGNIKPYPGDWGTTNYIVGGTTWQLLTLDQRTGIVYVATSVPEGPDMAYFPGPDLFDSSMIALNAMNGQMLWYYQMTTHDVYQHNVPFQSGSLARVEVGGKTVEALFAGDRNGWVYAFNAATGALLWPPVQVSTQLNNGNDNAGNAANMTLSQKALIGVTVCPQNGVYAPTAFAYGTLFVDAQNECATVSSTTTTGYTGAVTYSWKTVPCVANTYYSPVACTSSTPVTSNLYAIDGSTGKILWKYFMDSAFQGAAVTVSGGVVYAVDRSGDLFGLDAANGNLLLGPIYLGGAGQAGVSVGADSDGKMMLFATSGGPTSPSTTAATAYGYWIPPAPTTTTASCVASSGPPNAFAETCTAAVTGGSAQPGPTGQVSWTTTSSTGSFQPPSCDLGRGSSCTVRYTDTSAGMVTITASYDGDIFNAPSAGSTTVTIAPATTHTTVFCGPPYAPVGRAVTCVATVIGVNPTGAVSFASSSAGSFSSPSCTLEDGPGPTGALCQVTYTESSAGAVTITASYAGDPNNLPSSGSTVVTFR